MSRTNVQSVIKNCPSLAKPVVTDWHLSALELVTTLTALAYTAACYHTAVKSLMASVPLLTILSWLSGCQDASQVGYEQQQLAAYAAQGKDPLSWITLTVIALFTITAPVNILSQGAFALPTMSSPPLAHICTTHLSTVLLEILLRVIGGPFDLQSL